MMNTFISSRLGKRSVTFEKGFSRIASKEWMDIVYKKRR